MPKDSPCLLDSFARNHVGLINLGTPSFIENDVGWFQSRFHGRNLAFNWNECKIGAES